MSISYRINLYNLQERGKKLDSLVMQGRNEEAELQIEDIKRYVKTYFPRDYEKLCNNLLRCNFKNMKNISKIK
jgi:hypothetical protein